MREVIGESTIVNQEELQRSTTQMREICQEDSVVVCFANLALMEEWESCRLKKTLIAASHGGK